MNRIISYSFVVLFAIVLAFGVRHNSSQSVSATLATDTPPQIVFDTPPHIENNRLKAKISFQKQHNHHLVWTIGLQTLEPSNTAPVQSEIYQGYISEIDKLIAQGHSPPSSEKAEFGVAGRVGFEPELNTLKLGNPSAVRLKITLAQAAADPGTWRKADAIIIFSDWLLCK